LVLRIALGGRDGLVGRAARAGGTASIGGEIGADAMGNLGGFWRGSGASWSCSACCSIFFVVWSFPLPLLSLAVGRWRTADALFLDGVGAHSEERRGACGAMRRNGGREERRTARASTAGAARVKRTRVVGCVCCVAG
jgi:hypothetical protein